MILQRRISAYSKSTASLLAQLRELARLQGGGRKAELPGAVAGMLQQPPLKNSPSCVDPGPAGFKFSEDVLARLSLPRTDL